LSFRDVDVDVDGVGGVGLSVNSALIQRRFERQFKRGFSMDSGLSFGGVDGVWKVGLSVDFQR